MPLTAVRGANSLFVESAPGRADFAPVELDYGQLLRFDGASPPPRARPSRDRLSFFSPRA